MVDRWAPTPSAAPAHRRVTWRSPRSRPTPPPAGFIQPCQPTLVAHPPVGPGWLHEMKHDGYRLLARKDADRVTLWSRYGTDFTVKFEDREAVRSLPVDNALIDGEAVVFARTDIPILSRCAPRRAASKPHLSPSTFSASTATIFVTAPANGERRSRNWSQAPTASGSAWLSRPRARSCSPRPASWAWRGSCPSAPQQPLSQRAEPQLAQVPEPGLPTPVRDHADTLSDFRAPMLSIESNPAAGAAATTSRSSSKSTATPGSPSCCRRSPNARRASPTASTINAKWCTARTAGFEQQGRGAECASRNSPTSKWHR